VTASKGDKRYIKLDAVCKTQPAAVMEEAKKILGVEELEKSAQAYFEKCTAAAKIVYDNMGESAKKKIDDEVERWKVTPNEPQVQQK
jgi:hypothetical protein